MLLKKKLETHAIKKKKKCLSHAKEHVSLY
jgi:hypothetical protein